MPLSRLEAPQELRLPSPPTAIVGGLLCLAMLQGAICLPFDSAGSQAQLAALLAASAIGIAALLWIALDRRFERTTILWMLTIALASRGVAAIGSPMLEDDHYRYLWDGMRTATSFDPYTLPPSAFFGVESLSARFGAILNGVNNPDIPTIYGPILQSLFALGYELAPGRLGALQALWVVIDMLALVVLAKGGAPVRWLLAYAVNPLVILQGVVSAHPDAIVGALLACSMLMWSRRSPGWCGTFLGLAVCTKVSALVALPLLLVAPPAQSLTADGFSGGGARTALSWLSRVAGLAALVGLASYAPFWLSHGGSDEAGLKIFAQQWQFNPLLFRFIAAALSPEFARPAALCAIASAIALLVWRGAVSTRSAQPSGHIPWPAVDTAILCLLLFSPVVNPWYWLWAIPAATLRQSVPLLAIAAVAPLSFLNSTVLAESGLLATPLPPFVVPWEIAAIQIAAVVFAAMWERSRGVDGPRVQARS